VNDRESSPSIGSYSHNSGYVTSGGNLAKSIALFGMPPCDLEGRRVGTDGPEEPVTDIFFFSPGDAGNRFF
jgi:hypothetical protein